MRTPGNGTSLIRVKDATWKQLNALKKQGDTFDKVIKQLLMTADEAKLRISEEK